MPFDNAGFLTGVVADLIAGRDYIKRNGWCQNASRSGSRVCGFGGIFAVTGGHTSTPAEAARRQAACEALQRALDVKIGRVKSWSFGAWQDEPGRTVDDILALYDLAIELERGSL